jgi:competence protein ComFC
MFTQGYPEFLIDLLFPKKCALCGEKFKDGLSNILCRSCFDSIAPYEDPVCAHCGISLSPGAFEGSPLFRCGDCGEGDYFLDKVRAVGPYEGALRIAHHGFKFEGMEKLGREIGTKMLAPTIPSFWEGVKALVPVPLSSERERERGYNPSALLAEWISELTRISVLHLLQKTKPTRPQMSLTKEERLKNPKGAYQISGSNYPKDKIVLVDDVFTTGSTLEECARVLKKSGVQWVGAIVFGRTPHR